MSSSAVFVDPSVSVPVPVPVPSSAIALSAPITAGMNYIPATNQLALMASSLDVRRWYHMLRMGVRSRLCAAMVDAMDRVEPETVKLSIDNICGVTPLPPSLSLSSSSSPLSSSPPLSQPVSQSLAAAPALASPAPLDLMHAPAPASRLSVLKYEEQNNVLYPLVYMSLCAPLQDMFRDSCGDSALHLLAAVKSHFKYTHYRSQPDIRCELAALCMERDEPLPTFYARCLQLKNELVEAKRRARASAGVLAAPLASTPISPSPSVSSSMISADDFDADSEVTERFKAGILEPRDARNASAAHYGALLRQVLSIVAVDDRYVGMLDLQQRMIKLERQLPRVPPLQPQQQQQQYKASAQHAGRNSGTYAPPSVGQAHLSVSSSAFYTQPSVAAAQDHGEFNNNNNFRQGQGQGQGQGQSGRRRGGGSGGGRGRGGFRQGRGQDRPPRICSGCIQAKRFATTHTWETCFYNPANPDNRLQRLQEQQQPNFQQQQQQHSAVGAHTAAVQQPSPLPFMQMPAQSIGQWAPQAQQSPQYVQSFSPAFPPALVQGINDTSAGALPPGFPFFGCAVAQPQPVQPLLATAGVYTSSSSSSSSSSFLPPCFRGHHRWWRHAPLCACTALLHERASTVCAHQCWHGQCFRLSAGALLRQHSVLCAC